RAELRPEQPRDRLALAGEREHAARARRRRRLLRQEVAYVALRQVERERRAAPERRAHVDLAAEQARDLAADREAEAGPAVLPAGGAVGLLERFEDQLLLGRRDADAGVDDGERDHAPGALQHRVLEVDRLRREPEAQLDVPIAGELERVREEVLEHLLQPL